MAVEERLGPAFALQRLCRYLGCGRRSCRPDSRRKHGRASQELRRLTQPGPGSRGPVRAPRSQGPRRSARARRRTAPRTESGAFARPRPGSPPRAGTWRPPNPGRPGSAMSRPLHGRRRAASTHRARTTPRSRPARGKLADGRGAPRRQVAPRARPSARRTSRTDERQPRARLQCRRAPRRRSHRAAPSARRRGRPFPSRARRSRACAFPSPTRLVHPSGESRTARLPQQRRNSARPGAPAPHGCGASLPAGAATRQRGGRAPTSRRALSDAPRSKADAAPSHARNHLCPSPRETPDLEIMLSRRSAPVRAKVHLAEIDVLSATGTFGSRARSPCNPLWFRLRRARPWRIAIAAASADGARRPCGWGFLRGGPAPFDSPCPRESPVVSGALAFFGCVRAWRPGG